MNFRLDIMMTLGAFACVGVMFVLWFVLRTVRENRKIKRFCLSLSDSLNMLRAKNVSGTMTEAEKSFFTDIQQAFINYIKPNAKYKKGLLTGVNSICGRSYSLFDMYDCFENSRKNGFYNDIVTGSGYLFINMVYMSVLEDCGFAVPSTSGFTERL